ncbi:MAG: hypothetical protein J3R72DRAFT_439221 [Linnemannia gamsii]|nr:MAG: hypothetical protein J3R72DRAFT_439221 [Linnemannia gamsii]
MKGLSFEPMQTWHRVPHPMIISFCFLVVPRFKIVSYFVKSFLASIVLSVIGKVSVYLSSFLFP